MISILFSLNAAIAAPIPERVDECIYRGARPPSVHWLKEQGFQGVINLESGIYEIFHDDDYENAGSDVGELHEPWSDFTAPSVRSLKDVSGMLANNNYLHIKTYIHCLQGKDRTGMAVAAYKILYKGVTPDDAIKDMYAHGFHKVPYFFWVKQLRRLK